MEGESGSGGYRNTDRPREVEVTNRIPRMFSAILGVMNQASRDALVCVQVDIASHFRDTFNVQLIPPPPGINGYTSLYLKHVYFFYDTTKNMLLDNTSPQLALPLSTTHSFSPYPLASRTKTHDSILHPASACISQTNAAPGPGPSTLQASRDTMDRVSRRSLMGKRPFGIGMGKESDDLEEEEAALEQESVSYASIFVRLGSCFEPLMRNTAGV